MELNKHMVLSVVEEYCKLNNYAEATFKGFNSVLNMFDNFLNQQKKIKDYRDVKEKDYYDLMEYLRIEKHLKENTLKTWFSVIRKTFAILESEEKIIVNPFAGIRALRVPYSIRDKILSEDEIRERLNYYDLHSPVGFRNRTIFEVLYETGIRSSELINLDVNDFVKEEKLLFIRNGKGKKDRLVPLGESAYNFLIRYVEKIRKKLVKRKRRKYLFVGKNGEQFSKFNLWELLNIGYRKRNIKTTLNPHMLRHTCATHLLKNGAGIREIQLLLGHKSIKSTQIYINLNYNHLRKEYEKYHALENELYFNVFEREKKIINGGLKNNKRHIKKGLTLKSKF